MNPYSSTQHTEIKTKPTKQKSHETTVALVTTLRGQMSVQSYILQTIKFLYSLYQSEVERA